MAAAEFLFTLVAKPIANFIAKTYLGDVGESVGDGIMDIVGDKIKGISEKREAERQFSKIGDKIVARLVPIFTSFGGHGNAEAVAHELGLTLATSLDPKLIVKKNLDPAALTHAFKTARPLPSGQFSSAESALYHRALDETIRYMVQVAADLPTFEESFAAESLSRLDRLQDKLDEVIETTSLIENRIAAFGSTEADADLRYEKDYRQAVVRNLDYMELFGVTVADDAAKRHQLSVAYVSLNVKPETASNSSVGYMSATDLLEKIDTGSRRLLIRGEAGSGKSTLLRWIAISAAATVADRNRLLIDQATNSLGGNLYSPVWITCIPFLIRLRDCQNGKIPTPSEFPIAVARALGTPPEAWIRRILKQGRAIVLLDGIDEVPNVNRTELKKAIQDIVEQYPDNFYIVSTRPPAVPSRWLTPLSFVEAIVEPMTDIDKVEFVRKWHDAVSAELRRNGIVDATIDTKRDALIEKIQGTPSLSRLASTPLLSAMICAVHRERNEDLPESLRGICEAICEMLLHRRERESSLKLEDFPDGYKALTYDQKRSITQDIAHYMVLNEESAITRKRAEITVKAALKRIPSPLSTTDRGLLEGLIERSGVLREGKPGHVEFIHNTIKEYLAGDRFADEADFGLLAKNALSADWDPVIVFAAGSRNPSVATELIQKIISDIGQIGGSRAQQRRREVLALMCRSVAVGLDPLVNTRLKSIERKLFPPRTLEDAAAVALSGDAAVERLTYSDALSEKQAICSARALCNIGTPKAIRRLHDYTTDERLSVLNEVAHKLNPLEFTVVRESIVKTGSVGSGYAGLQRAIRDLSPLAKYPPLHALDIGSLGAFDLLPLRDQTGIERLRIWSDTSVYDIKPIAALSRLRHVILISNGSANIDVSVLRNITPLNTISLWGAISNVDQLQDLPELTSLSICNVRPTIITKNADQISSASLERLTLAYYTQDLDRLVSGCPRLRFLEMYGRSKLSIPYPQSLSSLALSYVPNIDDHLFNSPSITELGLTVPIGHGRTPAVTRLGQLPNLKSISIRLRESGPTRDRFVNELLDSLSKLSSIERISIAIDDRRSGMVSVDVSPLTRMKSLRSLRYTQNVDVSAFLENVNDVQLIPGRDQGDYLLSEPWAFSTAQLV